MINIKYNTKSFMGIAATVAVPANQPPNIQMPTTERNYCIFDKQKVDSFVKRGHDALPELKTILQTSNDEKEIVETLYILDRMIDAGVKGIPHMYPILARFNDTKSPNVQAYLAGIYRKTQVPDAFGPLVAMLIKNSMPVRDTHPTLLIKNSINPSPPTPLPQGARVDTSNVTPQASSFDPNEEIGGALLEYINKYSQPEKPKIDFSA